MKNLDQNLKIGMKFRYFIEFSQGQIKHFTLRNRENIEEVYYPCCYFILRECIILEINVGLVKVWNLVADAGVGTLARANVLLRYAPKFKSSSLHFRLV